MLNSENSRRSPFLGIMDASVAFAAGAVGMLTQLVWVRILIQWFGTSAVTIACALAASLAGLAMGAWFFRNSRESSTAWLKPLQRRADLLLILAGVGVIEGWLLFLMSDHLLWLFEAGLPGATSLLAMALIALTPMNIALGGILPSLVESKDKNDTQSVGVPAGTLYGAETLGGAVGAIAAGFYLIQNFGLALTLLAAGLIAIAVGALSAVSSVLLSDSSQTDSQTDDDRPTLDVTLHNQTPGAAAITRTSRIVAAIFLAGVASLSMEIVWQRALILLVGTDTHSYMIVAVSYLVGVALGSFLCSRFASKNRPILFSWLQLGLSLTSLLALFAFNQLASGEGQRWLLAAESAETVAGKRFLISFAILVLPSSMAGASFPAAVSLMPLSLMLKSGGQQDNQEFSSRHSKAFATGITYATLTIGNIVGVLIVGFFLIRFVGLQSSLIILCGIAVLSALLAARNWRPIFIVSSLLVLVIGGWQFWNHQPIGLGELPEDRSLLFYQEGPVSTVSVTVENNETLDGKRLKRMSVDGIVIGENIGGVDEKQQMLAHLPLLVNTMANPDSSEPLNAISIGLGTGILAGQIASSPAIKKVTCVELSPAVIDAANCFMDDNQQLSTNPVAQIIQGDGIHFLRQSTESYDCIVSDGKSRPGHAGNVAFFSSDYYRLAAERLADPGTFVQWVSLEGSVAEVQTILKTFPIHFPHAYIAIAPTDSIYLVGRKNPIRWNKKECNEYLQQARSLHPYGWRTADDILSMGWLDAHQVTNLLPTEIVVNSLDRPVLERFAMDVYHPDAHQDKHRNLEFLGSCLSDLSISLLSFDKNDSLPTAEIRDACSNVLQAATMLTESNEIDLLKAASLQMQSLKTLPRLSRGYDLADRILEQAELLSTSLRSQELGSLIAKAANLVPSDAELQMTIGKALLERKQFDRAASCFYRASRLLPDDPEPHTSFGRCLIELNKLPAAVKPLQKALAIEPNHSQANQLLRFVREQIARP